MIGPFGAEIDFLMQELAAGLVASGLWGGLSNFFPIGFLIALSCFPSRQASLKKKKSVITCYIVEKEYLIFFWNKQFRGQTSKTEIFTYFMGSSSLSKFTAKILQK